MNHRLWFITRSVDNILYSLKIPFSSLKNSPPYVSAPCFLATLTYFLKMKSLASESDNPNYNVLKWSVIINSIKAHLSIFSIRNSPSFSIWTLIFSWSTQDNISFRLRRSHLKVVNTFYTGLVTGNQRTLNTTGWKLLMVSSF